DRRAGAVEWGRMEDERPRLRPSEAAVERDQLLERAALFELRVVEAPDHDVADVREAVRAQQVPTRGGREDGERVLADHLSRLEIAGSLPPEDDGAALARADEQPADVRVRPEGRKEPGVA